MQLHPKPSPGLAALESLGCQSVDSRIDHHKEILQFPLLHFERYESESLLLILTLSYNGTEVQSISAGQKHEEKAGSSWSVAKEELNVCLLYSRNCCTMTLCLDFFFSSDFFFFTHIHSESGSTLHQ